MNALQVMNRYWKEVISEYMKELYKGLVSLRYFERCYQQLELPLNACLMGSLS